MAIFGLYIRDLTAGDLVWFTSDRRLAPGPYRLGASGAGDPDAYVAESIPALVLMVGRLIDQAEIAAQRASEKPDIPAHIKRQVASDRTDNLLQRLTETSSIWDANPTWVDRLRPL